MLPAWATVAITLGGAALGALAGTVGAYLSFRGGQLNNQHAEREAWRTRLVEAADAFSQSSTTVVSTVNLVVGDASREGMLTASELEEIRTGNG
jgi:hypothetical protein